MKLLAVWENDEVETLAEDEEEGSDGEEAPGEQRFVQITVGCRWLLWCVIRQAAPARRRQVGWTWHDELRCPTEAAGAALPAEWHRAVHARVEGACGSCACSVCLPAAGSAARPSPLVHRSNTA